MDDPRTMAPPRKRVLVADDDVEMRLLVRRVLETLGAEVLEASSGVALVSCLMDEGHLDLVVTDAFMPWMSGPAVVQMARAAGFKVPVLVMTAFPDEGLRQSIAGLSATSLMEKPFDMSDFLTQTRQILGLEATPAAS